MSLRGRSLLKEIDLTAEEIIYLIDLGGQLRMEKHMGQRSSWLGACPVTSRPGGQRTG